MDVHAEGRGRSPESDTAPGTECETVPNNMVEFSVQTGASMSKSPTACTIMLFSF